MFASLANVGANTVLYGKGGTNKSLHISDMYEVNRARLRPYFYLTNIRKNDVAEFYGISFKAQP